MDVLSKYVRRFAVGQMNLKQVGDMRTPWSGKI